MSAPNRGDAIGDDDPFDDEEFMDESPDDWTPLDGDIPGAKPILAMCLVLAVIFVGIAIIRVQSAKQPAAPAEATAKP